MKTARKLALGIGGWLQFEFACDRSGLFSEKYLASAVGNLLRADFGAQVHAEVNHPILAPLMRGAGRRPQIDFAIQNPYPNISVAVETKWHGSTPARLEDIIWDLIRLEMLVSAYGTDAFFILAGRKKDLDALFRRTAWLAPYRHRPGARPLLKTDQRRAQQLNLSSPPPIRASIIKKAVSRINGIPVPATIPTTNPEAYPVPSYNYQYMVYVWRVLSSVNRIVFNPH